MFSYMHEKKNIMGTNGKTVRLLDPIHGLITFRGSDDTDRIAWRLINTPEFQRLRRIRQLGFSEMVFPGATHTRFAHSIGVFHMARRLINVIRLHQAVDKEKGKIAVLAALLHDVGHGPFSHAFEGAMKAIGRGRKHEEWTAETITGDTEINRILEDGNAGLANAVASVLKRDEPQDIYETLVASQFDADRLDYLQRDRYMTGVGGGGFDIDWLLDCLEVKMVPLQQPAEGNETESVWKDLPAFCLNNKGFRAGEAYLWARWYLYEQVYLHKTTRGVEKLLSRLLNTLVAALANGEKTGIGEHHPLRRFLEHQQPRLADYLALDDIVIMGTWPAIANAKDIDAGRAELADRLVNRRILRCLDVGLHGERDTNRMIRFRRSWDEFKREPRNSDRLLLEDQFALTAYGADESYDRPSLRRVLVGRPDGDDFEDITHRSHFISSSMEKQFFRVYALQEDFGQIGKLWADSK